MKKKTATKIMSYLLTTAMIVGGLSLSPLATVEVQAAEKKNINLNVGNSIAGLTQGQDKNGSQIYYASQGTPIEWHAMATASQAGQVTTSMTLLADDVVENPTKSDPKKAMRYDGDYADWSDSELCTWLNKDATDGFLGSRFTTTEQSAINNYAETGKKIAIPSQEEVQVPNNWFTFEGERMVNSVFVGPPDFWWLRSGGLNLGDKAVVTATGLIPYGNDMTNENGSARPVFNLDLSKVLFSSESGASKSSSFATTSNSSTNSWNLTLQDGTGFAAKRKTGETGDVEAGTTMNITVTATASHNTNAYTQTSAMLLDDSNTVICYGRIKDGAPSIGDIEITIPSSVPAGAYTMKVFAEDVKSNNIPNATDYASNMAEIPDLQITAASTPSTPTPETPTPQTSPNSDNRNSDSNHESDSDSSSTTTEEAYVNPLIWGYAANQLGSLCLIEQQGELCVAAFNAATPKGYKEAFSFNLLFKENGIFKPSHVRRFGKFVLNIPKEWQKPGRIFILIGIDKFGNTKTFSDIDFSDETFTTMLDVEGYAFSLIYTDN